MSNWREREQLTAWPLHDESNPRRPRQVDLKVSECVAEGPAVCFVPSVWVHWGSFSLLGYQLLSPWLRLSTLPRKGAIRALRQWRGPKQQQPSCAIQRQVSSIMQNSSGCSADIPDTLRDCFIFRYCNMENIFKKSVVLQSMVQESGISKA